MAEANFILSPCGTSLLTNQADPREHKLITAHANAGGIHEIPDDAARELNMVLARSRENLLKADWGEVAPLSAELNAVTKYYGGRPTDPRDYHLLLCTDTWIGEQAAHLVADWLGKYVKAVEVKRQRDLQTVNVEAFQLALSDLVQWCEAVLPSYRNNHYRVVFNLTGGFKSVQGFLQTLAMFYADEAIYVFESGTELLRIPRLPVELTADETVRSHLKTFRRLAMGLEVESIAGIPETLLMRIGEAVGLSPWGTLIWENTKKAVYREDLWPTPSAKIRFTGHFRRTVEGIPSDRLRLVNERVDDLTRFLETRYSSHLRSLDFKPLKGNPKETSTHEVDAWADGNAKRIYGHYDGDIFVLDELAQALH